MVNAETPVVETEVPSTHKKLFATLVEAFQQASTGKGKERHGSVEQDFLRQPIMTITREHGLGFATGQAAKKLGEAHTLFRLKGVDAAKRELLGAIVYTAAAVIYLDEERQ